MFSKEPSPLLALRYLNMDVLLYILQHNDQQALLLLREVNIYFYELSTRLLLDQRHALSSTYSKKLRQLWAIDSRPSAIEPKLVLQNIKSPDCSTFDRLNWLLIYAENKNIELPAYKDMLNFLIKKLNYYRHSNKRDITQKMCILLASKLPNKKMQSIVGDLLFTSSPKLSHDPEILKYLFLLAPRFTDKFILSMLEKWMAHSHKPGFYRKKYRLRELTRQLTHKQMLAVIGPVLKKLNEKKPPIQPVLQVLIGFASTFTHKDLPLIFDLLLEKVNSTNATLVEASLQCLALLTPLFDDTQTDTVLSMLHDKLWHKYHDVRREALKTLMALQLNFTETQRQAVLERFCYEDRCANLREDNHDKRLISLKNLAALLSPKLTNSQVSAILSVILDKLKKDEDIHIYHNTLQTLVTLRELKDKLSSEEIRQIIEKIIESILDLTQSNDGNRDHVRTAALITLVTWASECTGEQILSVLLDPAFKKSYLQDWVFSSSVIQNLARLAVNMTSNQVLASLQPLLDTLDNNADYYSVQRALGILRDSSALVNKLTDEQMDTVLKSMLAKLYDADPGIRLCAMKTLADWAPRFTSDQLSIALKYALHELANAEHAPFAVLHFLSEYESQLNDKEAAIVFEAALAILNDPRNDLYQIEMALQFLIVLTPRSDINKVTLLGPMLSKLNDDTSCIRKLAFRALVKWAPTFAPRHIDIVFDALFDKLKDDERCSIHFEEGMNLLSYLIVSGKCDAKQMKRIIEMKNSPGGMLIFLLTSLFNTVKHLEEKKTSGNISVHGIFAQNRTHSETGKNEHRSSCILM